MRAAWELSAKSAIDNGFMAGDRMRNRVSRHKMTKITLDQFAVMVQKQFDSFQGQFDDLKEGQTRLEQGMERLEGRVGNLEQGQSKLEQGQRRLENQVAGVRDDLLAMRMELTDIKAGIARIEKRTIEDDDAIARELEKLKKRVKILEEKLKLAQ